MATQIININGGWIVKVFEEINGRQIITFLGIDGYYAKDKNFAAPFKFELHALRAANRLEREFYGD